MKPSNRCHSHRSLMSVIFLVVLLAPFLCTCQVGDRASIEQAIDNYIVGWRKGDTTLLKKAFDLEAGVVLWIERKEDPERLKSMKLEALAKRVKSQEGYGVGYEIQNIDVVGDQLAMAKVRIPMKSGNHYIDYLQLQKINAEWRIVLKSYVYFREE